MPLIMCLIICGQQPESELTLHHCAIEYAQSSLVGASEVGVLQEAYVRRGSVVQAGQVLATLRDGEARAQLSLRKVEAASDLDLKLRQMQYKQALNRQRISFGLRKRQAISEEQYLADQIAAELAAVEVEQASERRVLSQARLDEAEAKLRAKQITSPHAGVVTEVLKHPGESVSVGSPVFRVDNPEWLHLTGKLDVGDCWRVRVGATVRVHVELDGVDLPIEHQRFAGKITFMDSKIDHETQMCTVIASVENRDSLPIAGLEAAMIITASPVDRSEESLHARTSK